MMPATFTLWFVLLGSSPAIFATGIDARACGVQAETIRFVSRHQHSDLLAAWCVQSDATLERWAWRSKKGGGILASSLTCTGSTTHAAALSRPPSNQTCS